VSRDLDRGADAGPDVGHRARTDGSSRAEAAARRSDRVFHRDGFGRSVADASTVDIGVVLDDEAWLLLDDGSGTRVGARDAVVQRGTKHAWANRSDRPVRTMFVMSDGTITDEARAAMGPLEFFDQVLE